MRFVVLDTGSISPAHFSQPVIQHLRRLGHDVEILHQFDAVKCAAADLVWTEWVNEIAFEAAASGVCKRLVLRMRGYDVWFPLDQLKWENVDALVYESQTLKDLAEERFSFLKDRGSVIPAGIDLTKFPWKQRGPGNVFALVARATADKGYQLALEWARQNPQYQLHMTMLGEEHNPRLVRYVRHAAPQNVQIYGGVDTATWLNEIKANFLLLPTIWETLSYTVAEAMALGIKPLIHNFPGATTNWPVSLVWESFEGLNNLIWGYYVSQEYRSFVETYFDGAVQSEKFAKLLFGLVASESARVQVKPVQQPTVMQVHAEFQQAMIAGDYVRAEDKANMLAVGAPAEIAAGVAIQLAGVHYEKEKFEDARIWALRSMVGGPRTDALCLLGEIAGEETEEARDWYKLACAVPETRSRVKIAQLVDRRFIRLNEIQIELDPKLTPGKLPPKYVVVVPVRNAEKWIRRCLESIENQICVDVQCVVVDDASTDGTVAEIASFMRSGVRRDFTVLLNKVRFGSLNNIYRALHHHEVDPESVCVVVDGDDWLATPSVLVGAIEKAYQAGAWMTYGSWRESSGKFTWMNAYPMQVAREGLHRKVSWAGSHLKTFKRFLFDKVNPADFKDDAGEWFTIGGDVALMIPMLEMARERAVHIPDVLYTYNMETPDNDHKVDPMGQVRVRDLIFSRKPYPRLDDR